MTEPSVLARSLDVLFWMGAPVAGGWLLWRQALRRRADGVEIATALSRKLARLAMVLFAAPLMLIVMWGAPLPLGQLGLLPLVGLSVQISGTLAGWTWALAQGEPRRRQGAYVLGGGLSNVFTFGGITVVLLLSTPADPGAERALAFLAVYRLVEAPYYFLIAWPLAAVVSGASSGKVGQRGAFRESLLRGLKGPTTLPMLGLIAGILLQIEGISRPRWLDGAAPLLVRANVICLGITVGLGLRRVAPLRHLRACLAISGIKFVLMPVLGVALAFGLGFRGTVLQVVAVCASMPVAFMAVVGAVLYELDEDLVGAFWLVTTAAMVAVVPLLAWALPALGGS